MCTDARLRRLVAQTLVVLAVTASLAPLASAGVPRKASRAAIAAAKRVERAMRNHGAAQSSVRGCWRTGAAVDCAAMVKGNDGNVKWRCYVQIRIEHRGSGLKSKLTDVLCLALPVSRPKPDPDTSG